MGEWLPGAAIGSSFEHCLEVCACTNGKAERVVVIDDAAVVAEQGEVFMRAGHTMFYVEPVMLFLNNWGEYFVETSDGKVDIGRVYEGVVPSRYHRADIWPGIKVRIYDRDVLKRKRATQAENFCVVFLEMALAALTVFPAVQAVMNVGEMLHVGIGARSLMVVAIGMLMRKPALRWMEDVDRRVERFMGIPSIEEWKAN